MNCKGASRVYLIIQRYVWQETLSMGLVEEARPPFQEPPMHCLSWPEMVLLTSFKEPCDSLTTSDVSPRHSSHNPCTTLFSGNTKFIIFLTLKFLPTSSGVPPPPHDFLHLSKASTETKGSYRLPVSLSA